LVQTTQHSEQAHFELVDKANCQMNQINNMFMLFHGLLNLRLLQVSRVRVVGVLRLISVFNIFNLHSSVEVRNVMSAGLNTSFLNMHKLA